MAQPEQQAREEIDRLLRAAGWRVCDLAEANIHAARGVALREFPLESGFGFADYLLYVDGKAAGVIEAKKQGATLSGVEFQSGRYAQGLPAALPAWRRPLPFLYESTGIETHFTNGLDPEPRARPVFAFHTPEMLGEWLRYIRESATGSNIAGSYANEPAPTFLARMRQMPVLIEDGLWPAQVTAVKNLQANGAIT
ncbi:type I restriction endonuclease [Sulfuritalea sp.]|uniref:type I restriction endonuclease n=1 Tax=Sulfuritalea sp. TaxID=2480090 RepID=UPI00286DC0B8|nr:hypothetical protein [Sulfuritalea sp.]